MKEKYNINSTTLGIIMLYADNYEKHLRLREISRRVGIDVKAVRRQLLKLRHDNIILSEPNGKNVEYMLNLNNQAGKFLIISAEAYKSLLFIESKFIIKKLIGVLDFESDSIVILFGSFVKGAEDKKSDIDLLVFGNTKPNAEDIALAGAVISRKISINYFKMANFRNMLVSHDTILLEAISNHILLKGIDIFCWNLWDYYEKK